MKFSGIKVIQTPSYHVDVEWNFFVNDWLGGDSLSHRGIPVLLQPDFQRSYVWSTQQQRLYIESMLSGSPSGRDIYFNHPTWGSFEDAVKYPLLCVDGQQRIGAVRAYLNNELEVFGHYFNEYEDPISVLDGASFSLYVSNLKTKVDVLKWYYLLNSNCTAHSFGELSKVQALISSISEDGGSLKSSQVSVGPF
jgi:uncharacterized protein with ParB-like and HNH nuclease domain